MRIDVMEFLKANNVEVELKGYKEMQGQDGYIMQGTLYVNGKKAIWCEDGGFGGGCNVSTLNEKNAKPLTDINLAQLKAYPNDETLGDLPYDVEKMFYEMAEDFLERKDMLRRARTKTLVKFSNREYEIGEFTVYSHKCDKGMINHIIKEMEKGSQEKIVIWNIAKEWKSYTINELREVA